MKPTLVIGASTNPERYSYKAIHFLTARNHPVYAFGQKKGAVANIPIINQREEVQIPDLDSITLYLSPANQVPYYDWLISLKPKRVIFNPGTENPAFAEKLQNAGIQTLDACTLVLLSTGQY